MTLAAASQTKAGYYDSDAGKLHTGERMKLAYNTNFLVSYQPERFFIDHMSYRSGGTIKAGVPIRDVDGWWDCRPSGAEAWYDFISGSTTEHWFYGDTNWVLRWDEGDPANPSTVALTLAVEVGTGTPGRSVWSFPWKETNRVKVFDGYPINITFVPEALETAYHTDGDRINPDYIEAAGGANMIRFMDAMDTNHNTSISKAGDFKYDIAFGPPREVTRLSMQAAGEICTAVDSIPWICIPTYASDQLVIDLVTELAAYWSGDIAIEYSNEIWNTGFTNNWAWVTWLEQAHVDAAVDPTTGTVTSVAHGFDTGQLIRCFDWGSIKYDHPYRDAGQIWVVKDTDDTFRMCQQGGGSSTNGRFAIGGATKSDPCVVYAPGHNYLDGRTIRIDGVAGMTELNGNDYIAAGVVPDYFSLTTDGVTGVDSSLYGTYVTGSSDYAYQIRKTLDSDLTLLRYKDVTSTSAKTRSNYSDRSRECWALADGVIGRDKCIHILGTQNANNTVTSDILFDSVTRAELDYVAGAPYWNIAENGSSTNPQWWLKTDQQLTDQIVSGTENLNIPWLKTQIEGQIEVIGSARYICYEGGDGSSFSANYTEERWDVFRRWTESTEYLETLDEFHKMLADSGIPIYCHFKLSHWGDQTYGGSGSFSWGYQDWTGDNTSIRWQKINAWALAGGAPKN